MFFEAAGWQDVRPGFLPWREQREALAKAEAKRRKAAHARNHPPEACPGCGAAMRNGTCTKCRGFVAFQEETLAWDFFRPEAIEFTRTLRDKIRPKEVPKAESDIVF
jgi:hypothetical protein